MVIVEIRAGLGNQFYQYALARCLAHKLNTELKLDLSYFSDSVRPGDEWIGRYRLGAFNIQENIAAPEEIARVKANGIIPPPLPNLENFQRDIYIQGNWMHDECCFVDIIDIIRKEFTLKNPLSATAQRWKEKILAAECSVCLHFRHGDYAYIPEYFNNRAAYPWSVIPPLEYYYICLKILRHCYGNLTAFVFSDNLRWVKKNLRLDIPVEFVEGCATDDEEFILMSLCKHDIIPHSTFSMCASSLNANPDKKIFHSVASPPETAQQFLDMAAENKIALPQGASWLDVPIDAAKEPNIDQKPYFSLLLAVDDDAATIQETLSTVLSQDYKYYEVIIIDNASIDGSDDICRQVAKTNDKVTFMGLYEKITPGAAYNMALNLAQGDFVMFLNGKDRLVDNALTLIYPINNRALLNIVNSVVWFREDADGDIDVDGRKFFVEFDAAFGDLKENLRAELDKPTILKILSDNVAPLATKIFKRKFLQDNNIRFNQKITDDAKLIFLTEAMLHAEEMFFTPEMFYVAPKNI